MFVKHLFNRIAAVGGLTMLSASAFAGVIDTRPSDGVAPYYIGTGADWAGGTFTSDDVNLASFTLEIDDPGVGGVFRAVVLSTAGGTPSALLWQSGDVAIPGSATEFVFNPDLAITAGTEYFIGFDTGVLTASAGGDVAIGYRSGDVLAGGQFWQNIDGGGEVAFGGLDIASRIVMNGGAGRVPEPGSLGLLGLSMLAFVARRRTPA